LSRNYKSPEIFKEKLDRYSIYNIGALDTPRLTSHTPKALDCLS